MTTRTTSRTPLSRERVMTTAVELADRAGLEALTMRNLAHELGVEAMSLYYHVTNKEAILDGIVDTVMGEINERVTMVTPPASPADWKRALRERILTAREVLLRHRWGPEVIESRTNVSLETMKYFDGVLAVLRAGGFDYDLAHHAMHALGSRALGFTQELFEPEDPGTDDPETMEMLALMAADFPYLVGMMSEIAHDDPGSTLGWCDDQTEFVFGLDLILDGLDRLIGTSGK
ncbi:MAG: TetR/AcrR family transcriptional regulator C-terminal domain-containing protein [Actinobacteria bacterium]|nr:TetR/AcrR family transcriptional regulator C-terminal domain-containing protein [Actinomycetota bacterium]